MGWFGDGVIVAAVRASPRGASFLRLEGRHTTGPRDTCSLSAAKGSIRFFKMGHSVASGSSFGLSANLLQTQELTYYIGCQWCLIVLEINQSNYHNLSMSQKL